MNKTPQIDLSLAQIEQLFTHCQAWEERYRQLLLLAKQLQAMPEQYKEPQTLVQGCESEVWLHQQEQQLYLDSNARIIKGLIVIVLACYQAQPQNAQTVFKKTLESLGLAHHLSDSRNNGIRAIWQKIEQLS
ncbi:SufE family protein [Agarivorans sp.]|uniref:SufE family protein n=1 Tax=Agarivorans sp. TaxID=1872412 RepID=UPI003D06C0FC